MTCIAKRNNKKNLAVSLLFAIVFLFPHLLLSGQNCDTFSDLDSIYFDGLNYYKDDAYYYRMHLVANEYANRMLQHTNIDAPDFEAVLQQTAKCFLSSSTLDAQDDTTLIFLIFSSRTIAATEYSGDSYVQAFSEVSAQNMKASNWYEALFTTLTREDKNELYDILFEEFKQSHSPAFIQSEIEYMKRLFSEDKNDDVKIVVTTELPEVTRLKAVPFSFVVPHADQVNSLVLTIGKKTISSFETRNGSLIFSGPIELTKGENQIKISCVAKNGQNFSESYTVTCKVDDYMDRHDRAILFAVDDYHNVEGVVNLDNPIKDAEKLAKQLVDYGFDTQIIKNPTRKEILSTLRHYGDTIYGEYDQLLVFFAGHGTIDKDSNGYIIPSDASSGTDYEDFVNFDELANRFDDMKCNHILFICDACHSGAFRNVNKKSRGAGTRNVVQEYIMKNYKSRLLLCSCKAGETTYDKSQFFESILKLLKKENNRCSYSSIKEALLDDGVKYVFGSFKTGHPDGDFFFNKK